MAIINVGINRAYTTIMAAYLIAADGDVLLIDEGLYEETLDFYGKWVNLIGNTKNPSAGKVVIQQLATGSKVLYFHNITSDPTIYIEGLKINYAPVVAGDASSNTQPVHFLSCGETCVVINRCIIDASFGGYWVFNSGGTGLSTLKLYNCYFNYKLISEWGANGTDDQFERNGLTVKVDMQKCVLPFMIVQTAASNPAFPNGQQHNVANISNTTAPDFLDLEYVFTVYRQERAYVSTPTIDQEYYISTDLGSAKFITYFGIQADYLYDKAGRIELMGSNNLSDWDSLYVWEDADLRLNLKPLYPTTAFRYYKVGITATASDYLYIGGYILLEEGNDEIFFDYVEVPGKEGYGPAYGEFLYPIPTQYYFSGTISDSLSEGAFVDTVTFSTQDKAPYVTLSEDNHRATVSTTYKYTDYGVRATVARNTGKWYWEYLIVSSKYNLCRLGLGLSNASLYAPLGSDVFGLGYDQKTGYVYNNDVVVAETGQTAAAGDIVGVAYDAYNGKIWFSVNGVWLLGGDPVNGTNPTVEAQADLFPMVTLNSSSLVGSSIDFITNPDDFTYTIPNGFNYYGVSAVWRIKAINADTNELMGETYSDPKDNSYTLFTTYSGAHFLICEDIVAPPNYNDLILGRMAPEVW